MTTTYARIRTKCAEEYIHKFVSDWRESTSSVIKGKKSAVVILPLGSCEFEIQDGFLGVTVKADSIVHTGLIEDLISNHLDRLSQKERLHYPWVLLKMEEAWEASDVLAAKKTGV